MCLVDVTLYRPCGKGILLTRPYVLTKPIHGSQKKKKHDESGLILTIEVIPNIEFEKLILSFGEKVKVVSPKKIADLFKSKYISASKLY